MAVSPTRMQVPEKAPEVPPDTERGAGAFSVEFEGVHPFTHGTQTSDVATQIGPLLGDLA